MRVDAWLDACAAGHDTTLLLADPRPSAWTRHALQRADHVVVLADADGVVVVPAAKAAEVADAAEKRESFEGEKRARFEAGELGLDMYKMREPLAKAGLRYID